MSHSSHGPRPFSLVMAGYGVEVHARLPVGIAQLTDGTLIFGPINLAAAKAQGTVKNALLKAGTPPTGTLAQRSIAEGGLVTYSTAERGTSQLVLGNGMASYEGLLEDFRKAEHPACWRLLTPDHELQLPAGFTIRADGDLTQWPYELALDGTTDKLLFLRGPLGAGPGQRAIPTIEQLVGPGQVVTGQGQLRTAAHPVAWIELGYDFGGVAWRQRHYYLPLDACSVYLMTAQAPAADAPRMFAGADLVGHSFRPR